MKGRLTVGRLHAPCAAVCLPAAGCPKNGGAHNCRVVARSFFGSVCMTCGAWPLCHKVGTLVHVGGDFARDASEREWGDLPLKRGRSPG
jgi:hypothetical protein